MEERHKERRGRDRGQGGRDRGRDRRGPPKPAAALRPLLEKQRLDLDRPADQPLSAEEAKVMTQHLAFLRRFKGVLRLSLNAQEDLLVNGAKAPTDRGACRHLLAKIDRTMIDRALTRDPFSSDAGQRAAFLAGIVRIDPDPDLLLRYLEAVSETSDRRDAARAFSLTIDRLDFNKISQKQTQQILSVIARTFREHDRVQALFGLLENDSFRATLGKVLSNLEGELVEAFGPLAAAHRVVFEGEAPPDEDQDQREWLRGVELLLAAPDSVLRGYPEAARARIAELALQGGLDHEALRHVIASLPARDPAYVALRRARVEQLLAKHEVDEARSLLGVLLAAPEESGVAAWAKQRRTALDGKRVGPLIAGAVLAHDSPFRTSLWLDRASFVLAKIAPATEAGKLTAEARLQEQLMLPNVAPVLAHGLGEDGTVYLAIPSFGPVFRGPKEGASLSDRLQLCWTGAALLSSLAAAGVVMPDLRPTRFLERNGLILADFAGATNDDPARAGLAYGSIAVNWCRAMLETADRSTIPNALRRRLRGPTSLRLLLKEIAEAIAKTTR